VECSDVPAHLSHTLRCLGLFGKGNVAPVLSTISWKYKGVDIRLIHPRAVHFTFQLPSSSERGISI